MDDETGEGFIGVFVVSDFGGKFVMAITWILSDGLFVDRSGHY